MFLNIHRDTYELKLYKRKKGNNAYEYEENCSLIFKGSIATNNEKRTYNITKGVNGTEDSCLIKCSNLPDLVEVGDKVYFLGKMWVVNSVGYYYDATKMINTGFSNEYLIDRCPKGVNLG